MIENLIQAEKIVRAMMELEPIARSHPEYSEALNELLDLISQAIDDLQD